MIPFILPALLRQDKFYVFTSDECSVSSLGGLGMLRPDAFEHAITTDPADGKYIGREFVDNQWTDHFAYGPTGASQFGLYQSIETNFPVLDFGPSTFDGAIGFNHWSNFRVGRVREQMFQLDTSKCTKSEVALKARPFPLPLLRRAV